MARSFCLVFLPMTIYNLVDVVQSACFQRCISCTNDTCAACAVGSFLQPGSCHFCPGHCTSCANSTTCYSCFKGYFGELCEKECHLMCLNNTCHKDDGLCTYGCIEGYFGVSCSKCHYNCKTCNVYSNNCVVCKDGLYGPSCQNNCSHCKDRLCSKDRCTNGCSDGFFATHDTCNQCHIYCTRCESISNCHACENGYFGPDCLSMCNGCSLCNKEDGSCRTLSQTTSLQLSTSYVPTITPTQSPTMLPQTPADMETNVDRQDQDKLHVDKAIIIYVAAGSGGGLVVVVLVVVFVILCKRRGLSNQSETVAENMAMTENEQYISADEIDERKRRSTSAHNDVNYNGQEDNEAVYTLPNKIRHPTALINCGSAKLQDGNKSYLSPPKLPVKSNLHSDQI